MVFPQAGSFRAVRRGRRRRGDRCGRRRELAPVPGLRPRRPLLPAGLRREPRRHVRRARSGGRRHEGIDIFADEGTPIHAITGGTVVQGFDGGNLGGVVVRIQGDDGRYYYYAHLKEGSTDHLEVGQRINAGDVIGGVGNTGNAATTPAHLHFQVREDGEWINPFEFIKNLPDAEEILTGAGVPGASRRPVRDRPRRAAVRRGHRQRRAHRPVRADVRDVADRRRLRRRRPLRLLRDGDQPHRPAVGRHRPRRPHRRERDRARVGRRARRAVRTRPAPRASAACRRWTPTPTASATPTRARSGRTRRRPTATPTASATRSRSPAAPTR